MRSALISIRRRVQSRVIRAVRSSRLFPRSMTNRLGDDDALAGGALGASVIVYFPDALDNLYQVTPWLPAFELLNEQLPVAILCQDSRVASAFRERTDLEVLTIARYGTLDDLLGRSEVKVALYVSHAPRNFECLRFTSLLHVYLGHGDSDKGVSASNQLKAYDYAFLPGPAAVQRIRDRVMRWDVDAHVKIVGQPQNTAIEREPATDDRSTVLYAPTWEGAQPSVAYSSVLSHGRAIAESLVADPRFAVHFRPHPLSGVTSRDYAAATQQVVDVIRAAGAPHRVIAPGSEPLESSFARADLLLTDVSAVSSAWLPSLRPLVVTRPAGEQASEADGGMLAAIPRLAASEAPATAGILADLLASDDREARAELVRTYLSAYSVDESRARFVSAVQELAVERDALRAALATPSV